MVCAWWNGILHLVTWRRPLFHHRIPDNCGVTMPGFRHQPFSRCIILLPDHLHVWTLSNGDAIFSRWHAIKCEFTEMDCGGRYRMPSHSKPIRRSHRGIWHADSGNTKSDNANELSLCDLSISISQHGTLRGRRLGLRLIFGCERLVSH